MDRVSGVQTIFAADPGARASKPDLQTAAREFEGYLVGVMLRIGTHPLSEESPLDGGSGGRMYRELFYEEVARLASRGPGFGIADLLADGASHTAGGETP